MTADGSTRGSSLGRSGAVPTVAVALRDLREALICRLEQLGRALAQASRTRGRILAAFVRRLQITGVKYGDVVQQVETILRLRPGS
jgi:hypothetical protein